MSCKAYAKKLPHYVQGLLPEKEALAIAEHLKSCPGCQSAAEQLGSVWAELGSLPEADSPSVYPRVLARIEAYEQKRSGRLRAWLEPFMPSFAGAAAAVMLLGFVSGGLLSSVYYPAGGQELADDENSPYSELLAESPAASFFDIYLQSAGQNGKENTL